MSWNGSSPTSERTQPPRSSRARGSLFLRGALAGFLVIVGALVVWFVISPSAETTAQDQNMSGRGRIVDYTPSPSPARSSASPGSSSPRSTTARPSSVEEDLSDTSELPPGARTNYLGQVVYGESVVHTNAFRSGPEQVMAWIFTTEVGELPPVMPKVTIRDEQQLLDIFTKPLPINENDSERLKDAKETVEFVKKELANYLKEGGEIQDFLSYYREQLVSAHHKRQTARKMAMDLYRDGEDRAVCDSFVTKANERLAAEGIKTIEIPEPFIRKYAKEAE